MTKKHQGIVLVTGLIFLLILTIIGITTMSTTIVSEKMSQNRQDTTAAFRAAEAALSDGEHWLKSQASAPIPVTSCAVMPCRVWTLNTLGNFYLNAGTWWQSNGTNFSVNFPGVATQPQYVVEFYNVLPDELSPEAFSLGKGHYYYRVTARGVGETSNALVNVQSIFSTQYN